MREAIREAGLRDYRPFRSGTMMIGYVEAEVDFATSMPLYETSPSFQDRAERFDGVFTETTVWLV